MPFGPRLFTGIMGALVAAMMAGMNSRLGALALPDIRGALGFGVDDGQWINTVYSAAELAAMPVSTWLAITFSLRRYHLTLVASFALLAILVPLAPGYACLLVLRAIQGFVAGALIPVLLASGLRFFPPSFKLYGLCLYSLTATFAPNLAVWLAGLWTDTVSDWRFTSWQALPLALVAFCAVWWGIPQDPPRLERLRQVDWLGLATGTCALVMFTIGIDQGERLDWLHSPFIVWLFTGSAALLGIFLASEWHHPNPFIQLRLLARRNLWLGFSLFAGSLVVVMAGSLLPADALAHLQGFRARQIAPIGLMISLSQIGLAPATALLLYRRWVDARQVMAFGLILLAAACWLGSFLTPDWMVGEFVAVQMLHAFGQPLVIISLLFLATGVVAPMEGPYVAGTVNVLRIVGMMAGATFIGRVLVVRGALHEQALLGRLAELSAGTGGGCLSCLADRLEAQSVTLAIADAYRLLGLLALALIPFTYFLQPIRTTARGPGPAALKGA